MNNSRTPKKKKKGKTEKETRRLCHFNEEWTQNEELLYLLSKEDNAGRCKVCCVSFTVKYDSVEAVRRHARTESHISKVRTNLRSSTSDRYFVKPEQERKKKCPVQN
jgi:hypothetical protein